MFKSGTKVVLGTLLAVGALAALPAHAGATLDKIKKAGQVVCGVNTGLAGFSQADSAGNWTGLDADYCKALAAAVLGDANKVKWVPLNAQQRFAALQSGEVDVLSRNTTFSLTRDASLGLHATGVTYYDGQGFMVTTKSNQRRQATQRPNRLRAIRHHDREGRGLSRKPTAWASSLWCSKK